MQKNYPGIFDDLDDDLQRELNDAAFFTFNKMILMLWLISKQKTYSKYRALAEELKPLRNIEELFRNKIAHNIVTDFSERDLVIERPYKNSHEIYEVIFHAVQLLIGDKYQLNLAENHYDKLNSLILESMSDNLGFSDSFIFEKIPEKDLLPIGELQAQAQKLDQTINWKQSYDFIRTQGKWGTTIINNKQYNVLTEGHNAKLFLPLATFKIKIIGFNKNLNSLKAIPDLKSYIGQEASFTFESYAKSSKTCYGEIILTNHLKIKAAVDKEYKQYVFEKNNVPVKITEVIGKNIDQKFKVVPLNVSASHPSPSSYQTSKRDQIPKQTNLPLTFKMQIIAPLEIGDIGTLTNLKKIVKANAKTIYKGTLICKGHPNQKVTVAKTSHEAIKNTKTSYPAKISNIVKNIINGVPKNNIIVDIIP